MLHLHFTNTIRAFIRAMKQIMSKKCFRKVEPVILKYSFPINETFKDRCTNNNAFAFHQSVSNNKFRETAPYPPKNFCDLRLSECKELKRQFDKNR